MQVTKVRRFQPENALKAFGGRAPPGPAGGANSAPPGGGREGREGEGRAGRRINRRAGRRRKREREGEGKSRPMVISKSRRLCTHVDRLLAYLEVKVRSPT